MWILEYPKVRPLNGEYYIGMTYGSKKEALKAAKKYAEVSIDFIKQQMKYLSQYEQDLEYFEKELSHE